MDKELVAEWFRFANMDLTTAKFDLENMHPAPLEIICYHCQQAAEKYLKGVLIYFDAEPDKTHDLIKLMEALEEFTEMPDGFFRLLNTLTLYGVRTRYPLTIAVDEEQTKSAVAHAGQVKQWAESVIGKMEKDAQAETK